MIDLAFYEPLLGSSARADSSTTSSGSSQARHGNRSPNNAPRNAYRHPGRPLGGALGERAVDRRAGDAPGRAADLIERAVVLLGGERSRRAEVLDGAVQQWIAARELDEVLAAFEDAGAAIAPIYDVEQLVNDPHVVARDDDHDRRRRGPRAAEMQNLIFRLGDTPGGIRWTGRRLGQDNDAVLRRARDSTPSSWPSSARRASS